MKKDYLQFDNISRLEFGELNTEHVLRPHHCRATQDRIQGLLDATRAVTEDLDLDRMLSRITETAVALVGAPYAVLSIINQEGKPERFVYSGTNVETVHAIGYIPEGHGLLGAVINTGRTIRFPSLSEDPRSAGFPPHHPAMRSFLGAPIRLKDVVYGNLYLTDHRTGTFTTEDQDVIESLADIAGVAINNAQLYEEAHRSQRLSTALSEMNSALLSPDAEDVFGIVAEHLAELVGNELITIMIPADNEHLRIVAACGADQDLVKGSTFPAAETVAARAIETGTMVTGPFAEDHTTRKLLGGRWLGATASVPLVGDSGAIGALCVSSESDLPTFTHAALATVTDFASQAGSAIMMAWARQERQRLELAEDRSRIARDLHDHVIQRLFAAGLDLQSLATADPTHETDIVRHVKELDAAISDIRTAIFTLRTPSTADTETFVRHKLLDVITELTPALPGTPRITFAGPVDLVLTGTLAHDVVAVVRESLANVAKHANAEHTVVAVTVSDSGVTITIDDDGDGPDAMVGSASGTANLANRAAEHGGTFDLSVRSGGGTTARWSVPLPDHFAQESR